MSGFNKLGRNVTRRFFMNSNNQTGINKKRVHFKPFAFSKPPIIYRKTPMVMSRNSARKNKRKTRKKRV